MMNKNCCNSDVKLFHKPNAGICDCCHPCENRKSPIEDLAMCPPIGQTKCLTMMSPVVFDESGINLCRTVAIHELEDVCCTKSDEFTDILFDGLCKKDLEEADKIQLQVVDIDFNFLNPCDCRFSEIVPAKGNPNLSRITLKDINVTFAVKIIKECCSCKVVKEGMMTIKYLGDERECGFDPCTNPSSITFDLYTPYGISYAPENPLGCNKLVPVINYIGFVSSQCATCCFEKTPGAQCVFPVNNTLQQGISAQALAKVVAFDEDCLAIGLTLYLKVIYFVQYKFKHEGLTVPPKLVPIQQECDSCLDFVTGDLLEPTIKPLDVGKNANTLREKECEDKKEESCDKCVKCSCAKCACSKAAIN